MAGGEKQRMGLARLFYRLPRYGVLDEATSAVSSDVEGKLYAQAQELDITLITISHRPSLLKHHQLLLRIKERDEWELTQIGTEAEEGEHDNEIQALEAQVRDETQWRERLVAINKELGFAR